MASNPVHPFQSAHLEIPLGGRYKIIHNLGEGGFGQTFLAEDLHLPGHPRCVVKQLKPQVTDAESLQTARRLFDMEANVLYKLGNHEQIPRLLAHFEDGQEFYLAQEFIAGETLSRELVEGQPWSEANVVALLQDIVQVLTFVHQHHVIHRDIKPSNLIRRQQDGKIVLIDFGAVKQVSTQLINTQTWMTRTIAIGTQGYMPTEQLAGNPHFSSDIYAVGMIGIQALTGIYPSRVGIDLQSGEIDWHNDATHVSSELVEILNRMVRYDFRTRYPTALEALEALQSLSTVTTNSPLPQPAPELYAAHAVTVTLPARSSQPNSSASVSNASDGVTVTLPHRYNQPDSSASVSNALDDVTRTLPHRALSSLSPVTPATSPVATEIGKTAAVTPALRERSPSRLWFPVFGGTLATIAAVSVGTALLKAQPLIPLANESQNSATSSDQTSSPSDTSTSTLKSSTSSHTPLSSPSALIAPSDQSTPTPARVDDQLVRVVSQPQSLPAPIAPPARVDDQPVRAVKQPPPLLAPIAPPARVDDQPVRAVSQPQLQPASIALPARVDNQPVRAVKQPPPLPAPIAPPDYSDEQPIRVDSQPQPHRLPIAPPDRIVDQPFRGVSQPQSNPQVTGNKPTLRKEAAREQERSTRAVEQQVKEAAKERERELKEAAKEQERELKETAKEQERELKETAKEQERKPQKAVGKSEKRKSS